MKIDSETDLRKKVTNRLKGQAHVSVIESHATSTGFPDLEYCCVGEINTVELKYWGKIRRPSIQPAQITWHEDRIKNGGFPLIMVGFYHGNNDANICLYPGYELGQLRMLRGKPDWIAAAAVTWNNELPPEELLYYLQRPRKIY